MRPFQNVWPFRKKKINSSTVWREQFTMPSEFLINIRRWNLYTQVYEVLEETNMATRGQTVRSNEYRKSCTRGLWCSTFLKTTSLNSMVFNLPSCSRPTAFSTNISYTQHLWWGNQVYFPRMSKNWHSFENWNNFSFYMTYIVNCICILFMNTSILV